MLYAEDYTGEFLVEIPKGVVPFFSSFDIFVK